MNKTAWWMIVTLLLAAGPAFGQKKAKSTVGQTVSAFSLRDVYGKKVSMNAFPGAKGFIVVFTCNHCPFAKLYTDRLNALQATFKTQGVPLVAVNPMDSILYENETVEGMRQWAESQHFAFPYLRDASQSVARNFGAFKTPHAFVVWKENGQWVIRYSGAIDDNGAEPGAVTQPYLADAVNSLLAGQPVAIPETASIGCAISYRK